MRTDGDGRFVTERLPECTISVRRTVVDGRGLLIEPTQNEQSGEVAVRSGTTTQLELRVR